MPTLAGLYHELHGPLDAPPVLLSAGLGGSAHYWAPNLPALAARFRVIVYDHRGTGRSDPEIGDPYTVAEMAGDMSALLDALDIARAHVVGHAAGGVAGLALALTAPERIDRLVVVNGWASPDPHFARCFDTRLALLRGGGTRAYVQATPLFLYPADWSAEHSAQLDGEEDAAVAALPPVAVMEARIAALRAFDIALALATIRVPVLALAARDDMLVPSRNADMLAAGIPGATAAKMAWGGHACNVTDPDGFDRIVIDFLEEA